MSDIYWRKLFIVYVLKSINYKYHYIGHTKDLNVRLKQHNMGRVKVSKARSPFIVIYQEEYQLRSEAVKRERQFKKGEGNIWLRNKLINLNLW